MTSEERLAARKISRIMRTARKELGLNQETVSKHLGISQSALSKLEHGTLIPSAPQWFTFCRMTGISTESFLSGVIERNQLAVLVNGNREGTFKLPRRYAQWRGTKVRSLLPLLNFFEANLGEKKAREFMKAQKIDPDFFIDADNQIGLEFHLDVLRHLIQQNVLKNVEADKLTKNAHRAEMHGSLYSRYSGVSEPADRLAALVMNYRYYTCDFTVQIEDMGKNFDFSVTPGEHLDHVAYRSDPLLEDMMCRYFKSYFHRFAVAGDGEVERRYQINELECYYKGADRCIYRLETV